MGFVDNLIFLITIMVGLFVGYILLQGFFMLFDDMTSEKDPEREPRKRKKKFNNITNGQQGLVVTALRPTGTVKINGEIHHASSDTGFIDKDSEVTVVAKNGFALVVRPSKDYNT